MLNSKKNWMFWFKVLGIVLSVAYFIFCIYAGITRTIPGMLESQYIPYGKHMVAWVAGAIASIFILNICVRGILKDLNIWDGHEFSNLPFILGMVIPSGLCILLEVYMDMGFAGLALISGITLFLFGGAILPFQIHKRVAHLLVQDSKMSGKEKMTIIEWIHFYPLKKFILLFIWLFGLITVLRACWLFILGRLILDTMGVIVLFGIVLSMVLVFNKMRNYVFKSYRSVSKLYPYLTKQQIEQLMDHEHFEYIAFEDMDLKKAVYVYHSENWMVINGYLISKKLAIQTWCVPKTRHNSTCLKILYVNGMVVQVNISMNVQPKKYPEWESVLHELAKEKEGTLLFGRVDELSKRFTSFFLEDMSREEMLFAYLSMDPTPIRDEYYRIYFLERKRKMKENICH